MIHENAKIGKGVTIWHPELSNIGDCTIGDLSRVHSHVWIGDGVEIGSGCRVQAMCFLPTGVILKNSVFLGPGVIFTNDKYPPSDDWLITTVEEDAVIGANATILPGVTIGKGAKIGSGAVVTKNVPAGETWVGNPARLLQKHFQ